MQKRTKKLLWAGISTVIVVLFFAFGLPAILRAVLESQLEKNLHRPAKVQAVSFNPFALSLTITGLAVREKDGDKNFVSFDRLYANGEIMSVFEGGLDMREFSLERPRVHVVRMKDGSFNFSDLIPPAQEKPPEQPPQEPSKPFLFCIANIRIAGGDIEFEDRQKDTTQKITDLELTLPLISNFYKQVDQFTQPSFSARINGNPLRLAGHTKPFAESLETRFDIGFDNVTIAKFLPYAPVTLNFTMPSGSLSASLALYFIQAAAKTPEVKVTGKVSIKDLELTAMDGSPILKLPSLSVSGIEVLTAKRSARVQDVALEGLQVSAAREKDGAVSLQKLVGPAQGEKTPEPPKEPAPGPAWSVQVATFAFTEGAIKFNDHAAAQPVHFGIDPLSFTLKNISTEKGAKAVIDMNARIEGKSALAVQGEFVVEPLSAHLQIDLADLDIRPAQHYLPQGIDMTIGSGDLSVKGAVDLQRPDPAAAPAITWQGGVQLKSVALAGSRNHEDLFKAAALELQEMHVATSPLSLKIKTVKLDGLFLRPVVEQDKTINLVQIAGQPAPAAPPQPEPSKKKEPLPPVEIGTLQLDNSRIQFTDKSVKPRYTGKLDGIQGRIQGLSTRADSKADVSLRAKLNNYAPLTVKGTVSPLQEKLSADLSVIFDKIDLSPFSPYSGKFIGRLIEKGRLSLELRYHIRENKLSSENKVFLDQFTLGKSVKSPEATSLPVGLAISLLKNRKGEIHLDLPVSGSLDDPSFSVGSAILQVLKNLLEKAATSPFALVGAMIPGGEDLQTMQFPCGRADLNEDARKKLDTIAGLLEQKPDLKLEIQPVAEEKDDLEGLREDMVMDKLRQQKFNDLSKKEQQGTSPEKVDIPKDEYEDYLRQAYNAEKFDKPENVLGLNKRLPADEMKRLMLEHTKVDDEDMKDMLGKRGLAVKQYLTEEKKLPAERLFIIDPRTEAGKGPSGCSVEFKLQ